MSYVSMLERRGMGLLIEDLLRTKFGEEDLELMSDIAELNDTEDLLMLNRTIAKAKSLKEVRRVVPRASRRGQEHWSWEVENNKRGSSRI